ncbi:MAG: hypothetical protein NW203_11555 [Hyphomonadaceae bacterium]|nr:hypothetical protein [Hyphomonadaceae bacterium]
MTVFGLNAQFFELAAFVIGFGAFAFAWDLLRKRLWARPPARSPHNHPAE